MRNISEDTLLSASDRDFDSQHLWHPYSSLPAQSAMLAVASARGARITLTDGRTLLDGMSSWWSTIHGYAHPRLDAAVTAQLANMSHIMFGGLTHAPAIRLGQRLLAHVPAELTSIFYADSGSVAVEVALKMAFQYQQAKGFTQRKRMLALSGGYHGDTLGAMSVCDPERGMHRLFQGHVPEQYFVPLLPRRFGEDWQDGDDDLLRQAFAQYGHDVAALIVEPIVQGAGGMRFYHPRYLQRARALCDEYGVLLIADEIATGFGRTGRFLACEHAQIVPDILCLGKALTAGYMTLGVTLTRTEVAKTISEGEAGCFMHGPTFTANPMACAVADASLQLLFEGDWQADVARIEASLCEGLAPLRGKQGVADVRVLGAIGVVEMERDDQALALQQACVDRGVWVRPFGHLLYVMPPYIMATEDVEQVCVALQHAVHQVCSSLPVDESER